MREDLVPSLLSATILAVTITALLLEEESALLTLVPISLLLLILFLTVLYVSKTAVRYLSIPIAYCLLRSRWATEGKQNGELSKLIISRSKIKNCTIGSQDLNWRQVTDLSEAVRCLRESISGLSVPDTSRSPEIIQTELIDDLTQWEDTITQIKKQLPQENLIGSPSQIYFQEEFRRSAPDKLDSRLTRLVSYHLCYQNSDRISEYLQDLLTVLSVLTVVFSIIAIFEIVPSATTAYRTTFGVLMAALFSYYLNKGFRMYSNS